MKYDPEKHQRRSIRLRGYDYSQPGAYFITMCTQKRECMFGDVVDGHMELNEYGKIATQRWLEIPMHYPNVSLDECIIMPDHVHAIIIINDVTNGTVRAIHESPVQPIPPFPKNDTNETANGSIIPLVPYGYRTGNS